MVVVATHISCISSRVDGCADVSMRLFMGALIWVRDYDHDAYIYVMLTRSIEIYMRACIFMGFKMSGGCCFCVASLLHIGGK